MNTERRFSGVERLFGVEGALRIQRAHVVVVGIGGVGSWAAEALARSGVGQLTLIDMDHVAESNINRQIHAVEASLGQAKVVAMQERIHSFAPGCKVHGIEEFVDPDNWLKVLPSDGSAVIDACDQLAAKTAMAVWARSARLPFVSVGAAGGKRQAQWVAADDLSLVTHDPLLAKLRYRLRREYGAPRDGKKMGVMCVYSREAVAPPDASCGLVGDGTLNCHGFGSLVSVTATFGLCAAGVILNSLAQQPRIQA